MARLVNLNDHINEDVGRETSAEFPVSLEDISLVTGDPAPLPGFKAVVRGDTGRTLSIVSERYKLVKHGSLLNALRAAIKDLDVGTVPRGIYMSGYGRKLRALYKFPTLGDGEICPVVQVQNSYDATSRVSVQMGAYTFVCTNLAVGGGGIFGGGFLAIHTTTIPMEGVRDCLAGFLSNFPQINALYEKWRKLGLAPYKEDLSDRLEAALPTYAVKRLLPLPGPTVLDAYNEATNQATHYMRTPTSAFKALASINHIFQREVA